MILSTQYAFSLSNIELTSSAWVFTNQAPAFGVTTFTLGPGNTSFVVPIIDDEYHYVGEYGTETVTNESWSTVNLDHEMCDPVVVGSPTYDVDGTPQRTKKFKNLDADSFEVKADQWLNGPFVWTTPITWMVLEKWSHTLIDTTKIQAWSSTVSVVRGNPPGTCRDNYLGTIENFTPAFDAVPGVIYAVTSDNDTRWTDAKVYNTSWWRWSEPSTTAMSVTLETSFNDCVNDPEEVDWIAFDETHMTSNWIELDSTRTQDSVACCSATWYPMNYSSAFSAIPQTRIVGQMGEWWGNWSFAVNHTAAGTVSTARVSVDEDSAWSRGHANESIWQLAISNSAWYFVTENILTHTLGGTDAADFSLDAMTGSVASGVQLTLDTPPTCGDQTYTITIQSTDDHHCASESSVVQTITVNYVDVDTDGDGVADCEDVCENDAWTTTTGWPTNFWDVCIETSEANACGVTASNTWNILCTWACSVLAPAVPPTIDNDNDGYLDCQDCNDNDSAINPWATESCNGIDDDCDLTVDEWCGRRCDDDDNDGHVTWAIYSLAATSGYEKLCTSVPNINGWWCVWWVVWVWFSIPTCWQECTPSDGRTKNNADSDNLTYPWAPELCDINLAGVSWYMTDHEWDQDCTPWAFNTLDDSDVDGDLVPACADNCVDVSNATQADSNWYLDWVWEWDACEMFCGNNILWTDEECDDGNMISWDGCSDQCEIEYCRDDAPLNDTSKNFVVTDLTAGLIAWTSTQANSKVAICFEDTTGTRDVFYTSTDAGGSFTYSPVLWPYVSPRVNVGVMLHDENDLDIDHHSLILAN